MNYLLDTDIFIAYSRRGATSRKIEANYQLVKGNHTLYVSVVSLGEINSFIKRNGIGSRKQRLINEMIERCYRLDIGY